MSRNHGIQSMAWLSRVLTVTLLFLTVLTIVQMIVWQSATVFLLGPPEPNVKTEAKTPEELQKLRLENAERMFLPDGTVHWVCREPTSQKTDEQKIEVYDDKKQLLWQGLWKDLPYAYLWVDSAKNRTAAVFFSALSLEDWQKVGDFMRTLIVPVMGTDNRILERWRYEPAKRIFEGFDGSGRRIGYMGANGYAKELADVEKFEPFGCMQAVIPENSANFTVVWQTKKKIYEIRLAERRVDTLYQTAESEIRKIEFAHWWENQNGGKLHYRPMIVVWLKDGGCDLLLKDPRETIAVKIPDLENAPKINFEAMVQGIYIEMGGIKGRPPRSDTSAMEKFWEEHRIKPFARWIALYQVDPNGELKQLNRYEWTSPPISMTPWEEHRQKLESATHNLVTAISPIAYEWAWQGVFKKENRQRGIGEIFTGVARELRPVNKTINILLGAFMSLAVLAHAWPRRKNPLLLAFWLVFTIVFNLAGLLTYLGLNHTKVIPCPSCGKRRGLERPDCPSCGSALTRPPARKADQGLQTNPAGISLPLS